MVTPFLVDANEDDDYNYADMSFSAGQYRGTMVGRQQVISAPPWPLVMFSPRVEGTNFIFDFRAVLNRPYSVWSSTNLASTNWVQYTNLIGDGYVRRISAVNTNSTKRFFRLSSP